MIPWQSAPNKTFFMTLLIYYYFPSLVACAIGSSSLPAYAGDRSIILAASGTARKGDTEKHNELYRLGFLLSEDLNIHAFARPGC
jgi:hypothetical protein